MTYYNEHDPKAAEWLRHLIDAGHLPAGHVDSRDIQLVQPDDLLGYSQCHFFAGIGGWALALRLAGVPDDFPVWTGSCPCQPFSVAGKRAGTKDPRHLWPHFRRLIRRCRPPVVFGEQVASADGRQWLAGVCADLEALAYLPAAADLCAASVGPDCEVGILRGDTLTWEPAILSAPHIRQRLWWVARGLALTGPQSARRQLRRSRQSPRPPELGPPDQSGRSGGADSSRLDHPDRSRLDGQISHAKRPSWVKTRLQMSGAGCADGGLVQPHSSGRQPWQPPTAPAGHWSAAESAGGDGGVGNAGCQCDELGRRTGDLGCPPSQEQSQTQEWQRRGNADPSASANHFWSDFTLVPCRDGKTRRIESGTQPLVDGLPDRVGLLRGYGNAIVPQVAAEFIQASLEALTL